MDDTDIETELEAAKALLLKADYKSGLKKVEALRKKHPGIFKIEFQYAKILGDYADELPPKRRKHLKDASIKILARLIRRLNGQSEETRIAIRINFYYQTQRFKDLEKMGVNVVRVNRLRGLYSAGAGAALHAEKLARDPSPRRNSRAILYAKRASKYWRDYFRLNKKETYYFPYTLLAMSEAILGREETMEAALGRAAKLSENPAGFWEFEEVRKLYRLCAR